MDRPDSSLSSDGISQVSHVRPWTSNTWEASRLPRDRSRPQTTSNASKQSGFPDSHMRSRPGTTGSAFPMGNSRAAIQNGHHRVEAWSLTEVTHVDEDDGVSTLKSYINDEQKVEPIIEDKEEEPVRKANGNISWLQDLAGDSDEYDTELEDDFPPEPEPPPDATGKFIYEEQCRKRGITPASSLLNNLGEGSLRMRHYYLGGTGTKPLAQALKRNTVCEEIDLSDNYVDGDGASALAEMLKENMFVVNLNVSNNFMRSIGAHAFAEMLEANTTLKTLSLQGNQLSDSDAMRLSDAMKANMSLSVLDLSHNCFGELGGIYMGMGISGNIGLADLDLSWNGIREKGALAVAKALQKNSTLEIIDLSWNGLGHSGGLAMAQTIRMNKSLRVLDISNNRLSTEAAIQIGRALGKNVGLETLLMGMNPIGEPGVEAILKGITTNPTLRLVGLEDVSMSPSIKKKIDDMMQSRDILIMSTSGSPQQCKVNQTILAVFERFVSDNADRMEDLFHQMDKDKSGNITLEEFKYGLKDFGLRLTSKQLDMLLDELDADKSGTIEFDELMGGIDLVQQEKEKQERKAREDQIMQHSQSTVF